MGFKPFQYRGDVRHEGGLPLVKFRQNGQLIRLTFFQFRDFVGKMAERELQACFHGIKFGRELIETSLVERRLFLKFGRVETHAFQNAVD